MFLESLQEVKRSSIFESQFKSIVKHFSIKISIVSVFYGYWRKAFMFHFRYNGNKFMEI